MCFSTSELRKAIMKGDVNKVRQLLEEAGESAPDYINEDFTSDCFFDCLRRNTSSPLHTAISKHHWEIVWLLLDYGAEVNGRGFWYQTPLHRACGFNNLLLAKGLIDKYNADLYARDDMGQYPIHSACITKDGDFFEQMCQFGYFRKDDFALTDYNGNTPIHTAAVRDNCQVLKYIVKLGAEVNLTNNEGKRPIEVAKPQAKNTLLQLV